MTNIPSNAELPFVSERVVDDLLARMLRRQPEGESAEPSRLKLLDEFDDIMKYAHLSTYKDMGGIKDELYYISEILTETMRTIAGLERGQTVMAGDGSPIFTVINKTGESEFTQIPSRWQLHGKIAHIKVGVFNYDLTTIDSDIAPGGIRYVPFLELDDVFLVSEENGQVIDTPPALATISLPLDDDLLDLRQSVVVHEPHKDSLSL
jgi:hypothetical protein